MTKVETKAKISPAKLFFGVIITFAIFALAELLFIVKNSPETIEDFRTNVKQESLEKKYLEWAKDYQRNNQLINPIYYRFTPKVMYSYLSRINKNSTTFECGPICLSYTDSQEVFELFKKVGDEKNLTLLPPKEKSYLYFWMATISIWKNEEQTLKYLKKSTSLYSENEESSKFYEDLEKLPRISKDISAQEYFKSKINPTDKLKTYQKILLAKAAFNLSSIDGTENPQKIKYLSSAITLNPWHLDYYLSLGDIYQTVKNKEEEENILESCIEYLGDDSAYCKERLEGL